MTDQADEHVRRAIRDAMDRLIAGKPLHSDGKLTVKSLAEEARVKRWLLTHRHPDLQDEFRARIANSNNEPPTLVALRQEKADAQDRVKELTADVTTLTATIHQLERIVQVLALENQQLRSDDQDLRKVVPLRAATVHDLVAAGVHRAHGAPIHAEIMFVLTNLSRPGGHTSDPSPVRIAREGAHRWR